MSAIEPAFTSGIFTLLIIYVFKVNMQTQQLPEVGFYNRGS